MTGDQESDQSTEERGKKGKKKKGGKVGAVTNMNEWMNEREGEERKGREREGGGQADSLTVRKEI